MNGHTITVRESGDPDETFDWLVLDPPRATPLADGTADTPGEAFAAALAWIARDAETRLRVYPGDDAPTPTEPRRPGGHRS